ncbi:hypothetical protein [Stutzerimonas nitrititolerans]|nr:hypothetical protein [Stutzerimonas nitrititolerans]
MKIETALSRHETVGNKAGATFVSPMKFEISLENADVNIMPSGRHTYSLNFNKLGKPTQTSL